MPKKLSLKNLGNYSKLTKNFSGVLADCASVCFEHNQLPISIELTLILQTSKGPNESIDSIRIERLEVSTEMRQTHNDLQVAAELGACGIAVLFVRTLFGGTTIGTSRKGGGFDYYVAKKGSRSRLFQNADRLEVSGTLKGGEVELNKRVKQKIVQISKSDSLGTQSYVVVVEFSAPQSKVVER